MGKIVSIIIQSGSSQKTLEGHFESAVQESQPAKRAPDENRSPAPNIHRESEYCGSLLILIGRANIRNRYTTRSSHAYRQRAPFLLKEYSLSRLGWECFHPNWRSRYRL